jgi:hypothetical protein
MATFAERYVTFNDQSFQQRVGIALARVAYSVLGETVPGRHTLNTKRWTLARQVLADPIGLTQRFALLLAAHEVSAGDPDEVIENLIRQGFDQVAGVTPEDQPPPPDPEE